ncbi:MAG TPA: nucleotidyltransferase family protein [Thermoanaerobaculia bacterium]|nr:nucleotidyltransferase family protein [Thermoanaerobaculia bacterium]
MPPRAVRFRPPPVTMSPAILWMLRRAFGPPGAPAPTGVTLEEALALCRRFELSGRVAARQGRERLAAELGEGAAGFSRDQAGAVGMGLRLTALATRLAAVAASLDLPVVFLKFAALELSGALAPGSRSAGDVDLLVPSAGVAGAADLQRALLSQGFSASDLPGLEHQLPALAGPEGVVELHRVLLGVRLAGRTSATAEELAREGLLVPLPDLPGRAAVPASAVAVAHTLVHGLGQHGWWPQSYPLFKMIGDLIDLGLGGPAGAALAERAGAWIAVDIPRIEVEATRRLAAALVAGEDLAAWGESAAPEALLLRHLLAGRLDPAYERSLRLGLFRPAPSDRPATARLVRILWRTVFLTRRQVDAVYGKPRGGALGYLGRQLWRPLDLAGRLARYGASAFKAR